MIQQMFYLTRLAAQSGTTTPNHNSKYCIMTTIYPSFVQEAEKRRRKTLLQSVGGGWGGREIWH